jgi:pimeloyl-ACP methyl ester carboxylesterase
MTRRVKLRVLALTLLAALLAVFAVTSPAVASPPKGPSGPKPTLVYVHGAFADSSGWSEVASTFQKKGYPVAAFSNPLRGIDHDSEYLEMYLDTGEGPVILIGHSYGGAVISNAATGNPNVVGLVYIAAYALDAGQTVQDANHLGGGDSEVTKHLVTRPFPGAQGGDADAYIDPAHFHKLFAADLSKSDAAFLAASQRPGALASLVTPSGEPAWKTIPSWFMVASNDKIIPPAAERAMAERAGSYTVEVKSSHVPMLSQPQKVIDLIERAIRSTR